MGTADWASALLALRGDGSAGVLATVVEVRGHAPRDAGAKMLVSADDSWGSIGGGNLEAETTARSRELIRTGASAPEFLEFGLSEHATTTHGTQCCGGVVRVLLEPMQPRPTVALFGQGHVGAELARILSRLELSLHLVDTRAGYPDPATGAVLADSLAGITAHRPVAPETVLADLPLGAHVLVLTHDHAEDLAICDQALTMLAADPRRFGSVGLIGSGAKWARFRKRLREAGHADALVERIQCPIGVPDITGKQPGVIAVAVAADLLRVLRKAE